VAQRAEGVKTSDAQRNYAAIIAGEFRGELEAMLKKHGLGMQLGNTGKWAKLQLTFVGHPDIPPDLALTLVAVDRGQRQRYVFEVEENAGIICRCGQPRKHGG